MKKWIWGVLGVLIIILALSFWGKINPKLDNSFFVKVKSGSFRSVIMSTGQLQAEKSVSIDVPSALSGRRVGIYEIKITQLIEEGTVVDSGGIVASLDQSAVESLLQNARDQLEKSLRSLEDVKLDTNINLSNLRDGLLNGKVTMEEKELVLSQSKYESPAVVRQVTLDLERSKRGYEQDVKNYKLKKRQDEFKVQRALDDVEKQENTVSDIEKLFESLVIRAAQPGMVIYATDRTGNKIKVGTSVSPWSPQIALLPDLNSMVSKTYVNEVDIAKLKKGLLVKVGIDAFPNKSFDGEIIQVANIGQVLPGSDSKVFEVVVKLKSTDPDLKPAMTTSNEILIDVIENALFLPREALFKRDSSNYVMLVNGRKLLETKITIGEENENFVVITGLKKNDEVSLLKPENWETPTNVSPQDSTASL